MSAAARPVYRVAVQQGSGQKLLPGRFETDLEAITQAKRFFDAKKIHVLREVTAAEIKGLLADANS